MSYPTSGSAHIDENTDVWQEYLGSWHYQANLARGRIFTPHSEVASSSTQVDADASAARHRVYYHQFPPNYSDEVSRILSSTLQVGLELTCTRALTMMARPQTTHTPLWDTMTLVHPHSQPHYQKATTQMNHKDMRITTSSTTWSRLFRVTSLTHPVLQSPMTS